MKLHIIVLYMNNLYKSFILLLGLSTKMYVIYRGTPDCYVPS
jgi:hypothetical protein